MATPANHVWKPSTARTVTIDGFVPAARGGSAVAPPLLNWPAKDPLDVLDYQLDVSPAMAGNEGDTIATLDITVSPSNPGDLVLNTAIVDGQSAVVWFSAGQTGTVYTVTVLIGTASGRTLQRSILLPVLSLATQPIPPTAILTGAGVVLTDQNGNPVII
jgi:hypothetical protein